jgi:hypothetical protein
MDARTRALQDLTKLAEYIPSSYYDSEEIDPPMMRCKCGCNRELPLHKRRAIAQAKQFRRKAHPSDYYFGLCWEKRIEEKIKKIPPSYALKSRGRDKDGPNIKQPMSGILNP